MVNGQMNEAEAQSSAAWNSGAAGETRTPDTLITSAPCPIYGVLLPSTEHTSLWKHVHYLPPRTLRFTPSATRSATWTWPVPSPRSRAWQADRRCQRSAAPGNVLGYHPARIAPWRHPTGLRKKRNMRKKSRSGSRSRLWERDPHDSIDRIACENRAHDRLHT